MRFIFDLDGTLTKHETLPIITKKFGVTNLINELTTQTVQGQIPFMESFIKRVDLLGHLDVNQIANELSGVPLNQVLRKF